MYSHQDVEDVDVRPRSHGSRRSSRSGASSHVKTLSKNLIAPLSAYPKQDLNVAEVLEACLTRTMRTVLAMGMQKTTEEEKRGLLSRST